MKIFLLGFLFLFSSTFSLCEKKMTLEQLQQMGKNGHSCAILEKKEYSVCIKEFPYKLFIEPLLEKKINLIVWNDTMAFVNIIPLDIVKKINGKTIYSYEESPYYCIDKEGVKIIEYDAPYQKEPSFPLRPKK